MGLRQELADSDRRVGIEALDDLRNWLIGHIRRFDKPLVAELHNQTYIKP